MSSDGSVSSRISQFGLYRTIDARTEEFLRLSKKRQIKQGCVCAAISTALTVVIVVAIILIYEYNVMAEARRISTPTWLDLMNNSADDPTLQERFNRGNINIDKTTLKLLPILLKALNQNRHIEKVVDETTSLYPPYETGDTTDIVYTKNIFADTRNWMKVPNSRLFAIEYKTSPIIYFKNSTRNVDYFTKIRKIRDYQRMLNYVDKMINEKNALGSTKPMISLSHTEMPFKFTTPISKQKLTWKKNNHETIPKKPLQRKNSTCKCPHKLGELMHKLLASIQQLLSYFSGSNAKKTLHPCVDSIEPKPIKTSKYMFTPSEVITENHNVFNSEETKNIPYKTFLNRHKYTVDFTPTNNFNTRKDHVFNTFKDLLKRKFSKNSHYNIQLESNEAVSTTKSYVEPLETFSKYFTDTPLSDYITQKGTYDISLERELSHSSFHKTDFNDDNDYDTDQTENIENSINKQDISGQLLKNSITSEKKEDTHKDKPIIPDPFKGAIRKPKTYKNIAAMRKLGNLAKKYVDTSNTMPMLYRFAPISKPTTPKTSLSTKRYITKLSTKSTIIRKETKTQKFSTEATHYKITRSKQNRSNDVKLKKNGQKPWKDPQESTLKYIEEAIKLLDNETIINQAENFTTTSDNLYEWETIKLKDNPTPTISMIPLGRSTYLEMQRNDWKHEENHDYDNYIFD